MRLLDFIRKNYLLGLILLLASLLRFVWIESVPPAIGGDELNYIFTAKFIALRWTDTHGVWNPLSILFFHYPTGEFQAEFPYLLLVPFVKFFPLSIITVKSVYSSISVLIVLVIYFLAKEFYGKKTALAAAFVAAINPWFIFLGRTAYEMNVETLYYLLSLLILLKTKKWKILWSLIPLALAFYSHIATKIVFFPFALICLSYVFFENKKKFLKQYLIVGLAALLLTLFFVVSIKTSSVFSRASEIISINDPEIIRIVNETRKTTVDNPLNQLFDNKYSVFVNILVIKFFKTFSFDYLFLTGDHFYSLYTHGFFYAVDALFILFGMLFAFVKERKKFYLLFSLTLLFTIPHLIHTAFTDNFTPQIALIFPFLIIFAGHGIIYFYELLKRKIVLLLIAIIYLVSLLNFLNIYLYQFPLRETFDFKLRVMSQYVKLAGKDEKITIYGRGEKDVFKKYLFYTNSMNSKTIDKISEGFKTRKFELDNLSFEGCNDLADISKGISIIDSGCGEHKFEEKYISISRLVDAGSVFKIYNDKVCKSIELNTYATGVKLSDFNVESLSKERFCKIYITK